MEAQTPSRKGKFERSDVLMDVRNLEIAVNLPAKQTLDGSTFKRNGSTFVFTAPSGRTLTTKAKTRLVFDSSNSSDFAEKLPQEASKICDSALRNVEGKSNSPSRREVARPAHEIWLPNSRNRPKETSRTVNLSSGKVEEKNGSAYREISWHASENSKEKAKCEGETPNLTQRVDSEGFIFSGRPVRGKLRRRSSIIYHARASLAGNRSTPAGKLQQRPSKLSLSSRRHRTEAALKLKAMEDEETQASRAAQAKRELWLERQEKAYCAWLNFVLRQPMKVQPQVPSSVERKTDAVAVTPPENRGKREHFFHVGAGGSENEGHWRTPKRQMTKQFRAPSLDGLKSAEKAKAVSSQASSETCLQYVCSVSDLQQRLQVYLDLVNCEDVISTVTKLSKYIDDGRLKMKEGCAILADLALREKAVQVLMNYNAKWLRIGLFIVLGHNALVTKEKPCLLLNGSSSAGGNTDSENEFLKLLIEKHFLANSNLAKSYASNKTIEGLYRPGYYDSLGKVILKRFLLFVLALDKAKCQSALPIASGIDGLDGGSPLLFHQNTSVKASRQALQHFLSDVMHGEGDLIGHLATLGYQVFHVQAPLAEYDFAVTNLIENLQDGVRLCRLVQVMLGDASILRRVVVPCEYQKKHLHNCSIALQYLIDAGVPLSEEEGYSLTAEDLVMGDRERTLSLLWNIFVHLQIPLLISKERLCDEIAKVKGPGDSNMVLSLNTDVTTLDLMLKWIQAVCATYGHTVDNFRSSFADGQAFWYLIDYYLPGCMPAIYPLKKRQVIGTSALTIMDSSEIQATVQKFDLVQFVVKNMGNIPEVLRVADFLEGYPSYNERTVIILLAFLSARLFEGESLVEKISHAFKDRQTTEYTEQGSFASKEKAASRIQSQYRAFRERRQFLKIKAAVSHIQCSLRAWLLSKHGSSEEKAATLIQSYYRALIQRREFMKIRASLSGLQSATKGGLAMAHRKEDIHPSNACYTILKSKYEKAAAIIQAHYRAITERRRFLQIKAATLYLQTAVRAWLVMRPGKDDYLSSTCAIIKESRIANVGVENAVTLRKIQIAATVVIQCHIRGWLQRSRYILLVNKVRKIQQMYRSYKLHKHKIMAAVKIQHAWKHTLIQYNLRRQQCAAVRVQACWHGWLSRKCYKKQRAAVVKIQSWVRTYRCCKQYRIYREAVIKIQSLIRGGLLKQSYQKYKTSACKIQCCFRHWLVKKENRRAGKVLAQALEWEWILNKSAVVIQAAFRCWQEKQRYRMKRRKVILIQAIFRGGLVRQNLIQNAAVKTLGHIEDDISAKPVQLQVENGKQERKVEAARIIQRFYRGYAVRLLSFQERNQILISEDLNTGQVWTSGVYMPVHVNHGSVHDVSIPYQLEEVHANEIPGKYGEIMELRQQLVRQSVLKLQRWWREVLAHRYSSAVVIQSHVRGWASRRVFSRLKRGIVLIQACWRSYLVRKRQVEVRQQLLSLRSRIQNSAANVEDSLRLENRLTVALESLLSHKTISGILNTCATLDMATQHSKRCCERLVAAGAIGKLLQLIHLTNRSAPHEEILKHALSVLNNIAYYPKLAQLVVDTPASINTIVEQLFRSKEEAFSKAVEVLKKLCAVQNGVDSVQKLPPIIRRLQYLAQNLERKVEMERRGLARLPQKASDVARQAAERRLKEAISQHQSIILLLQGLTGECSQRRGSEVRRIRSCCDYLLKRASSGPIDASKFDIKGCCTFEDC